MVQGVPFGHAVQPVPAVLLCTYWLLRQVQWISSVSHPFGVIVFVSGSRFLSQYDAKIRFFIASLYNFISGPEHWPYYLPMRNSILTDSSHQVTKISDYVRI